MKVRNKTEAPVYVPEFGEVAPGDTQVVKDTPEARELIRNGTLGKVEESSSSSGANKKDGEAK